MNESVSPSRTYVAVCSKQNFSGYYFRKFVLPENYYELHFDGRYNYVREPHRLENSSETAAWYFLNKMNSSACIDGVISWEDYSCIEDEKTAEEKERMYQEAFNQGREDQRKEL